MIRQPLSPHVGKVGTRRAWRGGVQVYLQCGNVRPKDAHMNYADSIRQSMSQLNEPPRGRQRAEELYNEVLLRHDHAASQLKDDERIDLICTIGGTIIGVQQLGYVPPDFISVEGARGPDAYSISVAPVEQVTFSIVISKNATNEPKPQIGFHGAVTRD